MVFFHYDVFLLGSLDIHSYICTMQWVGCFVGQLIYVTALLARAVFVGV